MTFLNFFQFPKKYFSFKIKGKRFLGNQARFSLTGKYFSLTNFFNDKKYKKV